MSGLPNANGKHPKTSADVTIVGAGIIGLALALELHARGAQVTVFERDTALQHASTAAAGMLAAHDPHNPTALLPLAEHSLSLYPQFLERLAALSDRSVPFQTDTTIQYLSTGETLRLDEHSLDPRQLAAALLAAVRNTAIDLREHTVLYEANEPRSNRIVYTTGPWWVGQTDAPLVTPRKGQMLRVALPRALYGLREVHRSENVYIVPRTKGPQAGTALIGATVEDVGFDTATDAADLNHLRMLANALLPELAAAPQLEAWAGLRPATPDQLPLLGRIGDAQRFYATGHFRNGILLAPATASILADVIEGKQPRIDLTAFSPQRFQSGHPVDWHLIS